MTATPIPSELAPYLDRLVEVLQAQAPVDAVYLVGSAALGGYEHGRSDVDVVAVTARSLSRDERLALAKAVESIPVPARKLELVVYPRGSDRWELNLNTGDCENTSGSIPTPSRPSGSCSTARLPRSTRPRSSGRRGRDCSRPSRREAIAAALDEVAAFDGWDDPAGDAELAAARAQVWRETGRWLSKREAAERRS